MNIIDKIISKNVLPKGVRDRKNYREKERFLKETYYDVIKWIDESMRDYFFETKRPFNHDYDTRTEFINIYHKYNEQVINLKMLAPLMCNDIVKVDDMKKNLDKGIKIYASFINEAEQFLTNLNNG